MLTSSAGGGGASGEHVVHAWEKEKVSDVQ